MKLASYIPVCIILIPFLLALTKVYVYIGEANAYLGVVAMAAVVLNAMPAHPAIVRQLDKRFLAQLLQVGNLVSYLQNLLI